MNVRDIVIQYLEANGFDGLYAPGECGCEIADLAPCDDIGFGECKPGVKRPCSCGNGCDWDMGSKKERGND